MHVQVTPRDAVREGTQVNVLCDIWNWQSERSVFVVWLRRAHGSEVELGTNDRVVDQLRGRYSAKKDPERPKDYSHLAYILTINGTNAFL